MPYFSAKPPKQMKTLITFLVLCLIAWQGQQAARSQEDIDFMEQYINRPPPTAEPND